MIMDGDAAFSLKLKGMAMPIPADIRQFAIEGMNKMVLGQDVVTKDNYSEILACGCWTQRSTLNFQRENPYGSLPSWSPAFALYLPSFICSYTGNRFTDL